MINHMTRRAAAGFALGAAAAILLVGPLSPRDAQAATVSITVEDYDYSPATRTITAGDTVRWGFSGDPHSVTSRTGLFDSGVTDPGGSFQFRFTKAGTYRYYCVVHPDLMSGTIVVKAAAATPQPTTRPTTRPTPRPTASPTRSPATPSASPVAASPIPSAPPSTLTAPSSSAGSSVAIIATLGPSIAAASPTPSSPSPTGATDSSPILPAVVAGLVVLVAGGLWVVRRRGTT